MLTCHRNEDLADMLEDVEAGANPAALLRTVVGAIIELREAAHQATTVPPTDCSEEGDSGAEEEGEEGGEGGEEAAVEEGEEGGEAVMEGVEEGVEEGGEAVVIEGGEGAAAVGREGAAAAVGGVRPMAAIWGGAAAVAWLDDEEMAVLEVAEKLLGTCDLNRAE